MTIAGQGHTEGSPQNTIQSFRLRKLKKKNIHGHDLKNNQIDFFLLFGIFVVVEMFLKLSISPCFDRVSTDAIKQFC